MHALGLCVIGTVLMAGVGSAATVTETRDTLASPLEVHIREGRLGLRVRGAALSEVLEAIGAKAGFPVLVTGELRAPVTLAWADVPVDVAIKRLAGRHALVMVYHPRGANGGRPRLKEVRVYGGRNELLSQRDVSPRRSSRDTPPRRGGVERVAEDILESLNQPDRETRVGAIRQLGQLPPDTAVPVLGRVLSEEPDAYVRTRVVIALRGLQGENVTRVLGDAVSDPAAPVRTIAIRALGDSDSEVAAEILGDVLLHHFDRKTRSAAVRALIRRGGDDVRTYLEAATRDADGTVRKAAERALARWPYPGGSERRAGKATSGRDPL